MSFEVTGVVHAILDVETFDSGFKKQLFVLDVTDGQYTNQSGFELFKDATKLIEGVEVGDTIKVHFNLSRARYWQPKDRWFPDHPQAWKIEKEEKKAQAPGPNAIPANLGEENIPF